MAQLIRFKTALKCELSASVEDHGALSAYWRGCQRCQSLATRQLLAARSSRILDQSLYNKLRSKDQEALDVNEVTEDDNNKFSLIRHSWFTGTATYSRSARERGTLTTLKADRNYNGRSTVGIGTETRYQSYSGVSPVCDD